MEPRIVDLKIKKLTGMRERMSIANDKTHQLWRRFMSRQNEIGNKLDVGYYNMKIFDESLDFMEFNHHTEFEKWAAVEVSEHGGEIEGMEHYNLSGGKYAVFIHKGPADTFSNTLNYIFRTWLPESGYQLDQREHFEILQENYRPDDPNGEEEVWIPIK